MLGQNRPWYGAENAKMSASLSKTLKPQKFLQSISRSHAPSTNFSVLSAAESTTAACQPQDVEGERGRWSRFLLFIPGAITFGLGTWQIIRRKEKVQMLEYRRKRLEMEPIPWNELTSSKHNPDSLEFRKVLCEGYFDEGKSVYVGPRSRSISGATENGYYVITPFIPRMNDPNSVQLPVLVNRGWVPRSWRKKPVSDPHDDSSNSKVADIQQNEETLWWKFWSIKTTVSKEKEPIIPAVRVIGVVRGSEKPSIFVPKNDPNSGQWFYLDVPMIARACGLPQDTLYIEDINEDASVINPYPVPKDANTLIRFSVMPQDHLNYVFTCYILPTVPLPLLRFEGSTYPSLQFKVTFLNARVCIH